MIIKNPTTVNIGEFNFDYVKYPGIKAGESISVQPPLGDFMKSTWGFLEVIEEGPLPELKSSPSISKPEPIVVKKDATVCPFCGRDCKLKIGLYNHLKKCPKKIELEAESVVKPEPLLLPTPIVGVPVNQTRVLNKSEQENAGFGNSDGIIGKETKDMIAGREQKVIQDGDGVSWYGPGVTDDFSVSINKNKDFG